MKKTILILSNHPDYTYNFRKEVIKELLNNGFSVIVSSPYGEKIELLKTMGIGYLETKLERHGKNIFKEGQLLIEYHRMIKRIKPDIVISYTIKPNLYGGLVTRFLKIPFIPNITGFGQAGSKKGIVSHALDLLYKISFKKTNHIFFQNVDNMEYFKKRIKDTDDCSLIPGSGVNLSEFTKKDYPNRLPIRILYFGRIMKSKGVLDLLEAIKEISDKNIKFEFVGFFDDLDTESEFLRYTGDNIILSGHQSDVKSYIENASAIILPSHHEGMSNALLEAAAMGRPLLASNISGCKEIIDHGVNGFLFDVKNVQSIIDNINMFVSLGYDEREEMGMQSRVKVEKEFDRSIVVEAYLNIIKEKLGEFK